MKPLFVCIALLPAILAHADPPLPNGGDVAHRLVAFARASCDYLAAYPKRPRAKSRAESRLVAHFGRVVDVVDKTWGGRTFVLESPLFPGWHVEMYGRELVVTIPVAAQPRLRELAPLLGAPRQEFGGHYQLLHAKLGDEKPVPLPEHGSATFPWLSDDCFARAITDHYLPVDVLNEPVIQFSIFGGYWP